MSPSALSRDSAFPPGDTEAAGELSLVCDFSECGRLGDRCWCAPHSVPSRSTGAYVSVLTRKTTGTYFMVYLILGLTSGCT
ncbi:hypothetical protein NDU88_000429 [Pleurodeles waltl]|uniref:Uncharacterized protein n=1 Tax=Pleurodeles waltl TaxID=8319 RepID=A0AAV7UQG9_PLEWA|nr:hypothetical protein NDU88_000429 [Pleurodeles waltl]